jgi:hypothetical protein
MNVMDALYVCQLDPCFDESAIMCQLIQQGIHFHTLLPLKAIPYSSITSNHILPILLSGYKFTLKYYKAYQQQCQLSFEPVLPCCRVE